MTELGWKLRNDIIYREIKSCRFKKTRDQCFVHFRLQFPLQTHQRATKTPWIELANLLFFRDPIWQEIHHLWCFLCIIWENPVLPFFFSNKKRGWTLDQMDVVRQGWSRKLWKSLRRTALWWSVWYGCPGPFFRGSLVMWKITKRFQDLKK